MSNGLFDPENGLFSTLSMLVDIVGLSICWAFLCVPLISAGPATAALYFTVVRVFRRGEHKAFTLFFRSFWRELKRGCLCTLCFVPVAALFALLYYWYALAADTLGSAGLLAYAYFWVMAMVPVLLALWLFPLLGRFEFSVGGLFSTASKLALAHLPTSLLLLALTALIVFLILRVWALIFVLPSIWALLISLPLERAFSKHIPEDEV